MTACANWSATPAALNLAPIAILFLAVLAEKEGGSILHICPTLAPCRVEAYLGPVLRLVTFNNSCSSLALLIILV